MLRWHFKLEQRLLRPWLQNWAAHIDKLANELRLGLVPPPFTRKELRTILREWLASDLRYSQSLNSAKKTGSFTFHLHSSCRSICTKLSAAIFQSTSSCCGAVSACGVADVAPPSPCTANAGTRRKIGAESNCKLLLTPLPPLPPRRV